MGRIQPSTARAFREVTSGCFSRPRAMMAAVNFPGLRLVQICSLIKSVDAAQALKATG